MTCLKYLLDEISDLLSNFLTHFTAIKKMVPEKKNNIIKSINPRFVQNLKCIQRMTKFICAYFLHFF